MRLHHDKFIALDIDTSFKFQYVIVNSILDSFSPEKVANYFHISPIDSLVGRHIEDYKSDLESEDDDQDEDNDY